MTNEQYLIVSYFTAAGGGLVMAVITAALLRGALRQALRSVLSPLGRLLRRVLPAWLILAVLFAFMSVSYFDCTHHTYQEVVADRPHMIDVTRAQIQHMLLYVSIAMFAYTLGLAVMLAISPRIAGNEPKDDTRSAGGPFTNGPA